MSNLIGSGIGQIPTNGMLGNLAFQDKAYVNVDKVGIGTTFVDSGTAGQILQVYGGGAYVSGSVGIGTTNPLDPLDVVGVIRPRLGIRDSYGNVGAAGSVLVSTGAGVSWTASFSAGLQGTQGVQGLQGLQGVQGVQGLSNQGVQGHQGTQGLKGDQGVQGTGNQGVQGTQGLKGDQGTQGLQGLQGQTGPVAGSANQVVYKDGSNNPTGSNNLTFNGTQLNVYDLNVQNSLTIGGTSVYITATELRVQDKEIVLGLTTSSLPTDTTANHGGIAIASTEGTPLVPFQVGTANTLPDTYKQIMWVRSGTYSGLGTDAWLFNYGVGIGSTQVPNGVRLAAGGMQVTDSTISSPQINISGIGTFDKIDVNQLSPNGINYGASSQVPVADGLGGWSWQPVASAGAATSIFIEDEGLPKGGVTTIDFVGAGITASVVGSTATITLEISSLQGSQGLQGLQGNQGVQGLQGLSNQTFDNLLLKNLSNDIHLRHRVILD